MSLSAAVLFSMLVELDASSSPSPATTTKVTTTTTKASKVTTTTTTTTGKRCDALPFASCVSVPHGSKCNPRCVAEETALVGLSGDFTTCANGVWDPLPKCNPIPVILEFDFAVAITSCDVDTSALRDAALASLTAKLSDFDVKFSGIEIRNCAEESVAFESIPGASVVVQSESLAGATVGRTAPWVVFKTALETTDGDAASKSQVRSVLGNVAVALKSDPALRDSIVEIPLPTVKQGVATASLRSVQKRFEVSFSDQLDPCVFTRCASVMSELLDSAFNEIYGDNTSRVEFDDVPSVRDCSSKTKNDSTLKGSLSVNSAKLSGFTQSGAEGDVEYHLSESAFIQLVARGYKKLLGYGFCRHLILGNESSSASFSEAIREAESEASDLGRAFKLVLIFSL